MGFTYLASPFEHKNPDVMEARCESVRLITSSLVAKGDVVFSPIAYTENSELPEPPQGWLKFDLAMLQCADLLLIACMPGHQDSAGMDPVLGDLGRRMDGPERTPAQGGLPEVRQSDRVLVLALGAELRVSSESTV